MKMERTLVVVLILTLLVTALPGSAGAANNPSKTVQDSIARALLYLQQAQNSDGGFPANPGRPSSDQVTAWVTLALVAAGENLDGKEWAPGGRNPLDYLRSVNAAETTGDYARTLMALAAAEQDSVWQGRDLARVLIARQQTDGRLGMAGFDEEGLINYHMWSLLALAQAGREPSHRDKAMEWLQAHQNKDGGFGWYVGGPSDPDDTAVAIQTMLALGEAPESVAISRALAFLKTCQEADGGFRWEGPRSNLASTAWVIQALVAAGEAPTASRWQVSGNSSQDYLLKMQNSDGSFLWQQDTPSSPALMTAYAVMALSGQSFPLGVSDPQAIGFSDLPASHWAATPIQELVAAGVISGYTDGTFRPERPVTRAEFAALLVGSLDLGSESVAIPLAFTDVPGHHWARQSIATAVAQGFVRGRSDTIFAPGSSITGAEVMTMLVQALPQDVKAVAEEGTYWYSKNIAVAQEVGLHYPGFDPNKEATRAQCTYSLVRLRQVLGHN